MIVGLYGIMKAGAAYVPIDPNFPQTRIDFILKDIGSSIAVSNHEHMEKIQSTEHILNLDGLPEPGEEQIDFDSNDAKPHNLVYVIYTSGSTGMPKGTCIEHRNIISYLDAICERFSFNSPLSHAIASSLAADACKGPIFCALTTGGSVHILSHEHTTNSRRFVDYIEKYKPDTLKIVPSLLATLQGNLIADKILPQQLLILGGESSRSEWVLNWKNAANDCLIYNHYGPTETTVGVATYKTSSEIPITTSNSLPIGTHYPIQNCIL
jgi:non-ribosomal peptide synthetase component F